MWRVCTQNVYTYLKAIFIWKITLRTSSVPCSLPTTSTIKDIDIICLRLVGWNTVGKIQFYQSINKFAHTETEIGSVNFIKECGKPPFFLLAAMQFFVLKGTWEKHPAHGHRLHLLNFVSSHKQLSFSCVSQSKM